MKVNRYSYAGEEPGELTPVVIIQTRYGGTYEGGKWAAFHCDEEQIPSYAQGSDVPCRHWWDYNSRWVGVGQTPDEALADLESKLAGWNEFFWTALSDYENETGGGTIMRIVTKRPGTSTSRARSSCSATTTIAAFPVPPNSGRKSSLTPSKKASADTPNRREHHD